MDLKLLQVGESQHNSGYIYTRECLEGLVEGTKAMLVETRDRLDILGAIQRLFFSEGKLYAHVEFFERIGRSRSVRVLFEHDRARLVPILEITKSRKVGSKSKRHLVVEAARIISVFVEGIPYEQANS